MKKTRIQFQLQFDEKHLVIKLDSVIISKRKMYRNGRQPIFFLIFGIFPFGTTLGMG